jgi:hypothetical protein
VTTCSAQVIGRVCVAAFRSATIRHRELLAAGEAGPHTLQQILDQAFAIIGEPPGGLGS